MVTRRHISIIPTTCSLCPRQVLFRKRFWWGEDGRLASRKIKVVVERFGKYRGGTEAISRLKNDFPMNYAP